MSTGRALTWATLLGAALASWPGCSKDVGIRISDEGAASILTSCGGEPDEQTRTCAGRDVADVLCDESFDVLTWIPGSFCSGAAHGKAQPHVAVLFSDPEKSTAVASGCVPLAQADRNTLAVALNAAIDQSLGADGLEGVDVEDIDDGQVLLTVFAGEGCRVDDMVACALLAPVAGGTLDVHCAECGGRRRTDATQTCDSGAPEGSTAAELDDYCFMKQCIQIAASAERP